MAGKKSKTNKDKIKEKENIPLQKSIAMMAALGFLINSLTATGAITGVEGSLKPTIETNGNKTDVWAGKVNGENAFNHFDKFNVNANEIANLYFKEKDKNPEANRLFNFVNDQINVNGTVNAIKNGKIGGDLYFLSSSGMVVGNKGVINTGALYVITPTETAFDEAVDAAKLGNLYDGIVPQEGDISIPLNPKGTITVRGQVNAVDQIGLYAPTIQIGNVGALDTANEGNEYTNKVNLQTGVVDFSNLVNTNGVSGLSGDALKAEKTGNGDIILKAFSDGSSNILTEAELSIESVQEFLSIVGQLLGEDHKTKIETALKNGSSLVSEIDKLRPIFAEAKIEINEAKIISAGSFTAEATAINKTIEDDESGNAIARINAEINIKNSTIEAKKDVNINATANSIYVAEEEEEEAEGEEEKPSKLEQKFDKLFGSFNVDASVGVQKSSAVVNLEGTGITAGAEGSEDNINISAKNQIKVEIGAEIAPEEEAEKEKAGGTAKKKKKLAAAAAVIYADGDAKVNINNSKLTAAKGVNISSSSTNELNLNAGSQSAKETFTAAIGVTVGRNNSEVSIKDSTINSGENLDITSEVENSISSTVAVAAEGAPAKGQSGTGGSGTGTGNTGSGTTGTNKNNSGKLGIGATVNVVDYDSDSSINIEKSNLSSTKDTNISSKNTISENTVVADNTMGTDQSKFAKKTAMAEEKFDAFVEQVAGLFPGGEEQAQTRAAGTTGGTGTGAATAKSKVTAGAAVGVINEENSSNVTIKNSSVKAGGDLNITSETLIEDTHVSIAGDTYSGNTPKNNGSTGSGSTGTGTGTGGAGTKDNAISAAVLYSDIDNTSSITITDDENTTEEKTTLSGTNVNISSNVTMEYGRINAMINDLMEAKATLVKALEEHETLDFYKEEIQDKIKKLTDLIDAMIDYRKALTGDDGGFVGEKESFLSENSFTRMGEIAKKGVTLVNDIVTLIKNIPEDLPEGVKKQVVEDLNLFKAMIETATDFADGGNYANFYVRTATNDNNDKGTGLRIAGSAAINNLNNSSNINIGNVKIEATDGNVNISATNKTDTISIVGNMQELTLGILESTGENAKTTAVGGSFGMQNLENNSTITITEGTELIGEDITVATANDVFNVTASLSSGHSGKDAFNGMVSYVKGNSNSKVSIDDETNITAKNSIDISAINNSSLTNVAGAVVKGGNIAVGVSAAVNEYDVTTKAEIKDNDSSKELYTDDEAGTLTGNTLNVNANTDGMVNAISVAGGMSKEKNDQQSSSGLGGTGLGTGGSTGASINNAIGQAQGGLNSGLTTNNIQTAMNSGNTSQGGGNANIGGNNDNGIKLDLAGAGSVSINLNDNVTSAGIDGVNIVLSGEDKNISVEAKDEGFIGAWSGAAAINWSSKNSSGSSSGESSGTKVAVEGAIGLNILTNNTSAVVNNVKIKNADNIDINAVNDSVVVAAGLGLGVSNDGNTYAGGASVSLNLIDHYTTATLGGSNTEVSRDDEKTTDINVTALESGIQVTGGVNIEAGKAKGALGGAVTVGIINNNVTAGINGGTYNNIGKVAVDGTLNMTQVTAAAAIGITKTDSNGLSFQGAVVYNDVDNTVSSGIKNAVINASEDVSVTAGDSNIKKATSNKYTNYLEKSGIDADGSSYYDGLDISSTEDDYTKEASKSSNSAKNIENNKKGTTIITAAGAVSGSTGNAIGAGVIYDNITNKFTAEISNSIIEANNVSAEASADTFIVGAAGGVAASTQGKVGAMGSVSWQELNNTVGATINNSNITANKVGVNAQNTAFEVNVGGQISASKSVGAGAVLAYSDVKNNTNAEISGGSIDSSDTTVNANSETEIYTIGAGVSASAGVSLAGTVALNKTNNTTEASIKDKTTLTGVKNLNVQAINNDDLMNIVATITGAKDVAVGGSVAYSEIKNNVTAGIYNVNIATAETGEEDKERTIIVTADDNSEILTVAAAAGGSSAAAVQGAATTAIVNKTVNANLNNTNIDNTDAERADIQVTANNSGKIISSAGAVSGAGSAAAGAGVAVNKITNNTNASFDGGTQFVKNALVKGLSQADILTIGIGAAGSGSVALTGSIAINQIANNNNVSMSGTNLTAKGNVGVIAQSDDIISNYAGTLAAGGAAGVGVSTSVNEISGDTKVTIDNSKITAKGETDESITTQGQIDEVVDGLVKEMEIDSNLANDRTGSAHKGVVIDSSSTHTLKSLLANAAVAGSVALNGTVSVNQISGSTGTAINDSTITGKDVSVHTGDYTNSIGFVGTVSGSSTVGIGGSSDTHLIDRKLETNISESKINADNNVNIDNDAKQGISSTTVAGAAAGTAGIGATVTVTQLSGQTLLNISDTDINSKGKIGINNLHIGNVTMGNIVAGIGGTAGVGAGVAVTKDENITKTSITNNSHLQAANQIDIITKNDSNFDSLMASAGVGGVAGISGVVSVNNIENVVQTDIKDSSIILSEQNADTESSSEEGNHNININTTNNLNANITPIGAGVGGVGVAGVVTVNTINSSVLTNITNGNIKVVNTNAEKQSSEGYNVNISSEENRDIDQTIVSVSAGAVAVGANVAINSIGTAVVNRGDSNILETITNANDGQNEKVSGEILDILGKEDNENSFKVTATGGRESTTDEGIKVNINGGNLSAKNINVEAREFDYINMTSGGGSGGVVSVSASVGITDIDRKLGVTINNARITAEDKINIGTSVSGIAEMEMYQGSAGAIALGAAYGELNARGESLTSVNNSYITGNNVNIETIDTTKLKAEAIGLTGGAIAAGAIITDVNNSGNTTITIENTEINGDEKINIATEKANEVTSDALSGSVGIVTGSGVIANATDEGESSIIITNGNNSNLKGKDINILANNKVGVTANAGSVAVGVVTGTGSVSTAISSGSAITKIIEKGTIKGENVSIGASIGKLGNYTVNSSTDSVAGGIGAGSYNESVAKNTSTVKVEIDEQDYEGKIKIYGENISKINADIESLDFGGVFSVGVNKAVTENTGSTIVTVKGGSVNDIDITASTSAENRANSEGSGGGGIAGIGSTGITNTMNTNTNVNLSGNWILNGEMKVSSIDNNIVNLSADAVRGGFVGYNGINMTNNIGTNNHSTGITLANGTKIQGSGSVNMDAENKLDLDIAAEGAAYGGFGGSDINTESYIDKKANINLGNAQIITDGQQDYLAKTTADIKNISRLDAAGAIAETTGKIINTMSTSNNVALGNNGVLKTEKYNQNITLAATDDIKADIEALAETSGAGGAAISKVTNTTNRNNNINIGTAGNIRSMNDINLYAGADLDGKQSQMDLKVLSQAYAKVAIGAAKPTINNNVNLTNQMITGNNSKVESVKDININASSGENNIEEAVKKYTWYSQENTSNYVSTENGEQNGSVNSNNKAIINGTLSAGIQAKQQVDVSGIIDIDKNGGLVGDNILSNPNIDISIGGKKVDKDDEGAPTITWGTEDYGNTLWKRYETVCDLLSSYSDKSSAAYKGYTVEKERLLNEMLELGLAETVNKEVIPKNGLKVQYIEIKDMVASGGNITINSDALEIDKNNMKAEGTPNIDINNTSNLYLKVSDIRILEKGGKITHNGVILQDNSASSETPTINITNNWTGKLEINEVDAGNNPTGERIEVKPLSYIEINGNIENLIGNINIKNNSNNGNIIIQGKDVTDSSSVVASGEINIDSKGYVIQGYTDGIFYAGIKPEEMSALKKKAEELGITVYNKYANEKGLTNDGQKTESEDLGNLLTNSNSSGIKAGGGIFINAEYINVNGKIQSGYDEYKLELNDENIASQIKKLNDKWNNNPHVITDNNLSEYVLIEGGAQLVGDKFIYRPTVYYNPSTKEIIMDDISVNGGKVTLSGMILSTGGGKITALDGAANITAINNTDYTFKVGDIINNNVEGVVTISDVLTNKTIKYTRNETTITDLKTNKETKDKAQTVYNPETGIRYNWTEGTETGMKFTYTHSQDFYIWGAYKKSIDEVINEQSNKSPMSQEKLDQTGKPSGSFITTKGSSDNNLSVEFANKVDGGSTEISDKRTWTEYDNWTHFSGTDYYQWDKKQTSQQTYTYSIKADHGININFIGNDEGKINIKSNKDLILDGSIKNAKRDNAGTTITNITSVNGKITQTNGKITGDTINLSGVNGIEGIKLDGLGNTINLTATATNGNVDIAADKAINIDTILGKKINLSAYGDIVQQNQNDVAITGNRIDLLSKTGSINLRVNAGQEIEKAGDTLSASINASAQGNINLIQDEGNMRIGKIYSTAGDVILETEGYIIDALPTEENIGNESVDEMINRWKEAGIIDSEELRAEKDAAYAKYQESVRKDYETYKQLKAQELKEDTFEYTLYETLSQKYGKYDSAESYLADTNIKENQNQLALKNSGGNWNQNELLYAIQSSIVNPDPTNKPAKANKDPNIIGKNITIHSDKGVGVDTEAQRIDLNKLADNDYAGLKTLAGAEAADVTWGDGEAFIAGKNPIGIKMTSDTGKLDIQAKDNVYIAARTENGATDSTNTIYVNRIQSDGNIRVQGTAGIINNGGEYDINFSGKDVILQGGTGDIGNTDNAITTDISGILSTTTSGDTYIKQVTDKVLNIASIASGKDIFITAKKDIQRKELNSDLQVTSYINSVNGTVNLASLEGDIGSEDINIQILNNGNLTNISGNNIYITGKETGENKKGLVLGEVIASENVRINSEDSIKAAGNISGKDTTLTAENNIVLGTENENTTINVANLNMTTAKGNINQLAQNVITTNKIIAHANTGINLGTETNQFNTINLANNTGDILVNNSGTDGLAVTFNKDTNAGNVTINNVTGNMNITGSIEASGDEHNLEFTNGTGDIVVTKGTNLTAGNNILVKADSGNINTNNSNITAGNDIELNASKNVTTAGNIDSGNDLTITALNGDINTNSSNITAGKDIELNASKNVTTAGNIDSGNDLTITALNGDINTNSSNITAGNYIELNASKNVTTAGNINSGNDLTITALNGDINTNNSNITAGKDIILNANGGITNINTLIAGNHILAQSNVGNILLNKLEAGAKADITTDIGDITITDDVIAQAGDININITDKATENGITINGNLTAKDNINIMTENAGNISITGDTTTKNGDLNILAKVKGAIKVVGNLFANANTKVQTDEGDVNINGNITSSNGNTSVIGNSGNIDITGTLAARTDTNISTTTGYIKTNGSVSSGDNITFAAIDGNITTDGDINAVNRNINIMTGNEGNIVSNGNISAGTDIAFSTNTGNIAINEGKDNLTVNSGNNLSTETTNGNIVIGGKAKAGNETKAETKENGNINLNDVVSEKDMYVLTKVGDIGIENAESSSGKAYINSSEKGAITIGDISAGTTADVLTNIGDINIDKLEANDMVNIITSTEGAITNTTSLKSINDSLKAYSAKGDINLNDVYAKKTADTTAKDGNIYIGKIDGDYVIITLGKKDKEMTVEDQTVGKGTLISSNDLTIDNLYQREGENNPVEATFKNSEDNTNAPISYAELHAKGLENGILVNQLWVQDAEITTDSEILQFPELVVTGKGYFANSSTTATVYGKNSSYDDSNIHIWNDADTKDWIVLNFLPEENSIYTDGRLLKVQDEFYVYDQRISAEDYMIEHLKNYSAIEHKINEVKDPFRFVYKPYLQYNLIDNTVSSIVNTSELITTEDNKIIIKENNKISEVILKPIVKIKTEDDDEKEDKVAVLEKN